MNELKNILEQNLNDNFISAVLSNPRDEKFSAKVKVRPVLMKDTRVYQMETFRGNQAFHENLSADEACEKMLEAMENMKQMQLVTADAEFSVLISKKGKVTIKKKQKKAKMRPLDLNHNRKKQYILQEGVPVPFLQDLGVMTEEGKIVHARFDKFRQINRFLEMVGDAVGDDTSETLHIIDFGCGKSYLTFVLYYYFTEIQKRNVQIAGLDLKADVIKNCNAAAKKYGYENLHFEVGDINGYRTDAPVDMVVTLHACDTATDYALYNAIMWNARMILSVPCCQHELNGQIQSEDLGLMTRYGIIKERFAALATDAIRANLLECCGYKTQVLEFVDFAHTPKNLLIRAVKKGGSDAARAIVPAAVRKRYLGEVERMMEEFHLDPTLYRLLKEAGRLG